jgi:hypothetical protein
MKYSQQRSNHPVEQTATFFFARMPAAALTVRSVVLKHS